MIDCEIIKDLIPLYADDALSEKSKHTVHNHIEKCENCKDYYLSLTHNCDNINTNTTTSPETLKMSHIAKKLSRRKRLIRTIVSITTSIIVLIIVITVFDFARANQGQPPIFTLYHNKTIIDEGSDTPLSYTEYYGIGYKVIKYTSKYGRNDCDFGLWFLKPQDLTSINKHEIDVINNYFLEELKNSKNNNVYKGENKYFSEITVYYCVEKDKTTKKVYLYHLGEGYFIPDKDNISSQITKIKSYASSYIVTIKNENDVIKVIDVWEPSLFCEEYIKSIKDNFPRSIADRILSDKRYEDIEKMGLKINEALWKYIAQKGENRKKYLFNP